jgi:hypothetical protein
MLIFGHPWIESPRFMKIFSIEEIEKIQADEIVLLEPLNVSIDIAKYCKANDISFSITVNNIRDAVFANALKANYILCQHEQAIIIQKIADDYIFDTKILVVIEDEKSIDNIVRFGIDGVIFSKAIVQK